MKHFSRRNSKGYRGITALLLWAVAFSYCSLAADQASGKEVAELAPQDSLLYIEVADPAAFLQNFQKTELRQAAKSSFAAEVIVTFAVATADLISKSITGLSLDDTIKHYGLKLAVVASPPFAAAPKNELKPRFALIVRPEKNAAELKTVITKNLHNAITSRFPRTKITTEQFEGYEVTDIASPRGRVSSLAFVGKPAPDFIIYGRKPAVRWVLSSQKFLAQSPDYIKGREKLQMPPTADVFCFAVATPKGAKASDFISPGTILAGYLDILTQTNPAPVLDKILLLGDLDLPETNEPLPPNIGAVFPRGAYQVNQISFKSPAEMFSYSKLVPNAQLKTNDAARAFSGLGYFAQTLVQNEYRSIFAAALSGDPHAEQTAKHMLADSGYVRNETTWDFQDFSAFIQRGVVYVGSEQAIQKLLKDFSVQKNPLAEKPTYKDRFSRLPAKSRGYSLMTSSFLAGPGSLEGIEDFQPIVESLPLSAASAEKIPDGLSITSISPAGYGLWIVSLNVAALEQDQ